MKLIFIFSFLLIFTLSVPSVVSNTSHKARLLNLLRRPTGTKVNPIASTTENDHGVFYQQPNSVEYDDNLQKRNGWDSGEDYYFQWANQNRRPVEYLTGRKREVEKVVLASRDRRINGGLWRSGLVG